ncbi:MAG: YbaB/EbfC family nucleoid-associated protein [Flavobacteriaceae bacterium]|nr:YbaB/EbfC family nucleoid-associated protein [bacterium]MDG1378400.1 YbaB/EbfC family nucleoid-associated protein [Flavobacteriaceae bacterium]|tara:strand:- start:2316 stop:2639 length:324 start_codon:yes stop_codon:yes gene_type:complete
MYGDLKGIMGKLKETQATIEETKKRLNHVYVDESSPDGLLKVTISANRVIKSIFIDNSLYLEKNKLEDVLISILNKAITRADKINETELSTVAKNGMPNIPGLDLFK